MKLAKGEKRPIGPTVKVELDLEREVADQLFQMEKYTKISKSEIVTTALLRFISAHKDYFPDSRGN
ncbi:MAG: hypothetical protein HY074_13895 [Deltaproteobacteria bacterium]|nr:hypothetical protein [Deltaproteobacteria bacterium]